MEHAQGCKAPKTNCAPHHKPALSVVSTGMRVQHVTDLRQNMIAMLPQLRRFARVLTRSVPDADELVQEACLKALKSADQWDRTQPLDRWLFRILRNTWYSELRKRKVRVGEGLVPADETSELLEVSTGEAVAMAADLQRQVDALPPELGSVLLVVSVEGYSYSEAAELLDIPIGTVMSRIHRARKILAERIAETEKVQT